MPRVDPIPASCKRRRLGVANTAPNDRSESSAPPRIPTNPEDCSLCCGLEETVGRFAACRPSRGGQRGRDARRTSHKEGTEMSEDEARRITANEEQGDDVEAHRKHAAANDEGQPTEGDDDFEAHRKHVAAPKKA